MSNIKCAVRERVKKTVPKIFTLRIGTHENVVSVDHLQAHSGEAPVQPHDPSQAASLKRPWSQEMSSLLFPVEAEDCGGGGMCRPTYPACDYP